MTGRLLIPSLIVLTVAAASAEEVRPLEFIHALQKKGYHEIAVEYLAAFLDRQEKGKGTMPEEIADVFDLEIAKSMRGAASRAYNAKDASQLISKAQEHLNKFLKEKPEHPESGNAMVSLAASIMDDALENLRNSKAATDKAEQAKLFAAARAGIAEARSKFRTAADKIMIRIKALPPLPAIPKVGIPDPQYTHELSVRQRLNYEYFTAIFNVGFVNYYVAQTCVNESDPIRTAALKTAADMFNLVYQYNRIDEATGRVIPIGLQAHMWEGTSREELGEWQTAIDIYDECLANAPDPAEKSPPNKVFEPAFAQVQDFRMGIILKQNPKQFFDEAPDWLDAYTARWKLYDGFQAVALKLAKEYLKDPSRSKQGRSILEAMIRIPSSSQQEAYELLKGPGDGNVRKLEDAKTMRRERKAVERPSPESTAPR
jgi:tetratricopeptide (TPR) repeat protein